MGKYQEGSTLYVVEVPEREDRVGVGAARNILRNNVKIVSKFDKTIKSKTQRYY